MILITGATGQLGKAVANYLLAENATGLAVFVRDTSKVQDLTEKGVEVRVGSYDDYNSMLVAFKGVDKLYFVSGSDIEKRTKQHENVVKAAKEAGVGHIVYTSFIRNDETEKSPIAMVARSHIKAEEWIKESGMNYTILRHNIYMDMIPMFIGDQVLETGVIYLPAGETKVAFMLRDDMALAGARVLLTEGHENKVYDITNESAVTFSEIASGISRLTGKAVNYVSPSTEEYIKTLTTAGVPIEFAGFYAGFAEAFKLGEFSLTNNQFEILTGRKPVSVDQFLAQVYSAK